MSRLRRFLNNQALGILPLLLAVFLDLYFLSYFEALGVGLVCCLIGLLLFSRLKRDTCYQFLLLPTLFSLLLYCAFLFTRVKPILVENSPLVAEILLVVVLAFSGFTRKSVLYTIRHSSLPSHKRTMMRASIDEAYFIGQVIQNLYTLHLFSILIYIHLPESMRSPGVETLLYKHLGLLIGILVIIYGHLRIYVMHGKLKKEIWLPVLNDKGRVIGSMARSVSRSSSKRYFHPIVRVAVLYDGMLYLSHREKNEYVSPGLVDYPFYRYVLFHQSIEKTVRDAIGRLAEDTLVKPRFMIRYTFENEKVKHLVSLYVICLHTEDQLKYMTGGKLWTPSQVQENIRLNLFSEYFEKEFPYLQNTVLLAESFSCGQKALS